MSVYVGGNLRAKAEPGGHASNANSNIGGAVGRSYVIRMIIASSSCTERKENQYCSTHALFSPVLSPSTESFSTHTLTSTTPAIGLVLYIIKRPGRPAIENCHSRTASAN